RTGIGILGRTGQGQSGNGMRTGWSAVAAIRLVVALGSSAVVAGIVRFVVVLGSRGGDVGDGCLNANLFAVLDLQLVEGQHHRRIALFLRRSNGIDVTDKLRA